MPSKEGDFFTDACKEGGQEIMLFPYKVFCDFQKTQSIHSTKTMKRKNLRNCYEVTTQLQIFVLFENVALIIIRIF